MVKLGWGNMPALIGMALRLYHKTDTSDLVAKMESEELIFFVQ